MPPLAVPRPPVAAALQAATRLPVQATAQMSAFIHELIHEANDCPIRDCPHTPSVLVAAGDPAGSWLRWSVEP